MDRRQTKRWVCICGAGLLAAAVARGQEPSESSNATSQPPTLPEVTVEAPAPETTTAPVLETFAPTFDPSRISDQIASFTYEGSPFGDFGGIETGISSGAPLDPFNSPRSITTLDLPRIQERTAGTTPELFEGLPGVLIQRTNPAGGSLIIRGRNGNQNLIMIDGVPINDAGWRFANIQYLNTIDPGVIERIEVLRGPESVLYGSGALGGVVNIVTKSRKDYSQTFDAGLGVITNYSTAATSPYNRLQFQGNFQSLGVFGGGSLYNPGALYAGEGRTYGESIVGYDQGAGDIRLDWKLGDIWTVTFNYQYLRQNDVPRTDRFPTPLVDPARFVNRPTFTNPQEREFGYLRLSGFDESATFLNGLTVTLDLQRRSETEFETTIAERNSQRVLVPRSAPRRRVANEEMVFGGIDIRGFTFLSDRNTLSYGTTYYHDWADASRTQQTGNGPVTRILPTLPPDGEYGQFGVFLMDSHEVFDWLTLNAGVRYSSIHASGTARFGSTDEEEPSIFFDRTFTDWSWETGAVVRLTNNLHWVSSIAKGFRAPNLEDLAADERSTAIGPDSGNINLDIEYGINYETGLKFRGEWLSGGVTTFYTNNPSQIVRNFLPGGITSRANTEGYLLGTEVEGALRLTQTLSLFTTGAYATGDDITRNEPLRSIPPYMTLGGRWASRYRNYGLFFETWTEMMASYDRLSESDRRDIRIPIGGEAAWQTFNLRGGIDTDSYGRLTCGLYNIFDQNYRIVGSGVDATGIDFRVGYELQF